jgi:hypothetical protein
MKRITIFNKYQDIYCDMSHRNPANVLPVSGGGLLGVSKLIDIVTVIARNVGCKRQTTQCNPLSTVKAQTYIILALCAIMASLGWRIYIYA